jgi:uncharacterized protein YjbI with pentapeptide repeats
LGGEPDASIFLGVLSAIEFIDRNAVCSSRGVACIFFSSSLRGRDGGRWSATTLVKPDQYNAKVCEDYFSTLKPGLTSGYYDYQEHYAIEALCKSGSVNLSLLVDGAAADDIAAGDALTSPIRTLRAEFVKAVITSHAFDSPGYDGISISGAIIDDDLNLSKITMNNALQLEDVQFLGNVDFSYSSTTHNLDVSGTFPDFKVLCLKGFQTTSSVFIDNLRYQPDQQLVQKSICADNFDSPSIGLRAFVLAVNLVELSEESRCDRSTIYLEGTHVQGSAEFVRSDLCGISMTGARVSNNVDLLGSRLAFFDFSGSNAEGDLQIGPSRGPPARLPVWLLPFGNPRANLVLSHSSVTVVRVALNNWPNICNIPLKPEQRNVLCTPPRDLKVATCSPGSGKLQDLDDHLISMNKLAEWTGLSDLIFGLDPNSEKVKTTIAADFRFKGFGNSFSCAWDGDRQSDYILNDSTIDENKVELWLASTQYSPAEYQLISDLLVTNGQNIDTKKIGYASKIIETRMDLHSHAWDALIPMLISRWINGYGYYSYLTILWPIFFARSERWYSRG